MDGAESGWCGENLAVFCANISKAFLSRLITDVTQAGPLGRPKAKGIENTTKIAAGLRDIS